MIKLRAHETDATAAINGLINDINIELGTIANGFASVADAIALLDKRLTEMHEHFAAPEPVGAPEGSGSAPSAVPDAPVPTL